MSYVLYFRPRLWQEREKLRKQGRSRGSPKSFQFLVSCLASLPTFTCVSTGCILFRSAICDFVFLLINSYFYSLVKQLILLKMLQWTIFANLNGYLSFAELLKNVYYFKRVYHSLTQCVQEIIKKQRGLWPLNHRLFTYHLMLYIEHCQSLSATCM